MSLQKNGPRGTIWKRFNPLQLVLKRVEKDYKSRNVFLLKFGKSKKMDYLREAPDRSAALLTLILVQ